NLAAVQESGERAQRAETGAAQKPRQMVGVYVAWRSNVFEHEAKLPEWVTALSLDLSFWNRKRVAAQVAGISCTEAILSLAAQTRLDDPPGDLASESKVILVGHSFGGLILERAVAQAMLGGLLANTHLGRNTLRKP